MQDLGASPGVLSVESFLKSVRDESQNSNPQLGTSLRFPGKSENLPELYEEDVIEDLRHLVSILMTSMSRDSNTSYVSFGKPILRRFSSSYRITLIGPEIEILSSDGWRACILSTWDHRN
jgi:hypothetical protein